MLQFVMSRKRQDVRKLFHNRMNNTYYRQFKYGKRAAPRSNFSEVVWLMPSPNGNTDFSTAVPMVTKDCSVEGVSVIGIDELSGTQYVVALDGESGPNFVSCKLKHCTDIGYGYFQIGLHPMQVVKASDHELYQFEQAQLRFDTSSED